MLEYIYTRAGTNSTTGYYSCLPAASYSPEQAITLLASRPFDTFLYEYVFSLLVELSKDEIVSLQQRLSPTNSGFILSVLLAELELLKSGYVSRPVLQDNREILPQALEIASSPLRFLIAPQAQREMGEQSRACLANIDLHSPVQIKLPVKLDPAHFQRVELKPAPDSGDPGPNSNPSLIWKSAVEACTKAAILNGPEMRHEASLSPIALLRNWNLRVNVSLKAQAYVLTGTATSYGRGLSLAQARTSCIMEVVERVSAYPDVEEGGEFGDGWLPGSRQSLRRASMEELAKSGEEFLCPALSVAFSSLKQLKLFWLCGEYAGGTPVWLPFQAVALFANLPEANIFQFNGSTGLGAGETMAQARLAAVLEVVERDAHATTPFSAKSCFVPYFHDPLLRSLLEDYHARGIFPQFQDITPESGVPVYRCFVQGLNGQVAQATGAALNGLKAAISALTETPWPYSWSTPAPYGIPSAIPAPSTPVRYIEDLPNYDQGSHEANLAMLETALAKLGLKVGYANLTRKDLGFPVVRAIISGLSPNSGFSALHPPSDRFFARLSADVFP